MSDVKNEVNKQTDSLAPIQDKDRIMGWGSYLMLWLGGCISIGIDHGVCPVGQGA